MDREQVLERMRREKIIAIVRGVETASIGGVALALTAGGITCMEITVDHRTQDGPEETYRSIAWLRERMGEAVCLGAGTVLDEEETRRAVAAGADYIISPNLDERVIRLTRELGKVSIPGTFTPSEAVQAYRWGADIVKLFPAGLLGPDYIKALKGPLPHIPFCAVGGITPENAGDFIRAGCVSLGIGGNLVNLTAVREKRFGDLTAAARRFAAGAAGLEIDLIHQDNQDKN
ncbi:bifunctional 4-hydroxy-2-oxoglutarate aldolase/2-dehydro-3-deoxy-phosphogluconate aldolase [Enterocloster asparagiformis]|uniref:bifunctional 4-hydroxy-2-oxoglutarate aldolase/2-dehydro-3-deoxy-phosphogluconate aldolase n=1 Tax=Enterocloster asparagiformis TaxID=333367 RepID=UPI00046579CF|nr:bifunctional 4-hydroxy-2-oxoglutarate aldolase/2-dehydro-3-deoxy-phosphogluconate aldolase [Enterocloster asparagiformis]